MERMTTLGKNTKPERQRALTRMAEANAGTPAEVGQLLGPH